jgi:hypothetical protein
MIHRSRQCADAIHGYAAASSHDPLHTPPWTCTGCACMRTIEIMHGTAYIRVTSAVTRQKKHGTPALPVNLVCSNRTEALGKPMARGHVIPADMGTTRAFGMTYNSKVRPLARRGRWHTTLYPLCIHDPLLHTLGCDTPYCPACINMPLQAAAEGGTSQLHTTAHLCSAGAALYSNACSTGSLAASRCWQQRARQP